MDPITQACCALYFGAWSWHSVPGAENETHNLIGIKAEALFIGHMENSYGNESWIVGFEFFRHDFTDKWTGTWNIGFASGYKNEEAPENGSHDVQPFMGPGAEYHVNDNLALVIGFNFRAVTLGFNASW